MITNISEFIIGQLDRFYQPGVTFQLYPSPAATSSLGSTVKYTLGNKEVGQNYIKAYFYLTYLYPNNYYNVNAGCLQYQIYVPNVNLTVTYNICFYSSFDIRSSMISITVTAP